MAQWLPPPTATAVRRATGKTETEEEEAATCGEKENGGRRGKGGGASDGGPAHGHIKQRTTMESKRCAHTSSNCNGDGSGCRNTKREGRYGCCLEGPPNYQRNSELQVEFLEAPRARPDQRYVLRRAWRMGDGVKISTDIYFMLVPFPQGNLGGASGCNAPFWVSFAPAAVCAACGAGGTGAPRQYV
jgi:hypothetical protein